jgi:hypothetical protein
MKTLFIWGLFICIPLLELTAQEISRFGNITPAPGGSFEKLKEDKLGLIYVVQYFPAEQKSTLWQFNGTDWKCIQSNQFSWKSILDFEIDSIGQIYILATAHADHKQMLIKFDRENWDTIQLLEGTKGILLNQKQDLMAFGKFGLPGKYFFVATYENHHWIPLRTSFENSFIQDQFNEKNLSEIVTEQDGTLIAHLSFFKKPETRNYYCQLKQGMWKLLPITTKNRHNQIVDFSSLGNEDDFITEAAPFGNNFMVIAGPGGNSVYQLKSGEKLSKYNQ